MKKGEQQDQHGTCVFTTVYSTSVLTYLVAFCHFSQDFKAILIYKLMKEVLIDREVFAKLDRIIAKLQARYPNSIYMPKTQAELDATIEKIFQEHKA